MLITTNEERELPSAFLRRCLVLHLQFPDEDDAQAVAEFLLTRARVHWSRKITKEFETLIREQIVPDLLEKRAAALELGGVQPGAAEFLDILRVLLELYPDDLAAQREAFERVRTFALVKNPPDRV